MGTCAPGRASPSPWSPRGAVQCPGVSKAAATCDTDPALCSCCCIRVSFLQVSRTWTQLCRSAGQGHRSTLQILLILVQEGFSSDIDSLKKKCEASSFSQLQRNRPRGVKPDVFWMPVRRCKMTAWISPNLQRAGN